MTEYRPFILDTANRIFEPAQAKRDSDFLIVRSRNSSSLPISVIASVLRDAGLEVVQVAGMQGSHASRARARHPDHYHAQRQAHPAPSASQKSFSARIPEQWALTTSERRVACLLLAGLGAAEISARLNRSVATVRTHMKRIYAKAKVHSQRELLCTFTRDASRLQV